MQFFSFSRDFELRLEDSCAQVEFCDFRHFIVESRDELDIKLISCLGARLITGYPPSDGD